MKERNLKRNRNAVLKPICYSSSVVTYRSNTKKCVVTRSTGATAARMHDRLRGLWQECMMDCGNYNVRDQLRGLWQEFTIDCGDYSKCT